MSLQSRWDLIIALYIVISAALGKKLCSLRRRSIFLIIFLNTIFIWSSNFSWLSGTIPRCFWEYIQVTLALLNSNGGWTVFFNFWLKMTSCACLVVSGLKFVFHRVAQLLILSKSLLRLFAEVWMSCITENKEDCHV